MVCKDVQRGGVSCSNVSNTTVYPNKFVVASNYLAFWKKSRTAWSSITVSSQRRVIRPCRYRSCRSWYRRPGRQFGYQLPDGQHHRSLCTQNRYVVFIFFVQYILLIRNVGRTGRAGKTGVAITFLTNDDDEVMYVHLFYVHYHIANFPRHW